MQIIPIVKKKNKFKKLRERFSKRYRQCSRCGIDLNIDVGEEIVCGFCGETFCPLCIDKHQKFCYGM